MIFSIGAAALEADFYFGRVKKGPAFFIHK
jgi:hypothetical protein